jgi:hypothetical protein
MSEQLYDSVVIHILHPYFFLFSTTTKIKIVRVGLSLREIKYVLNVIIVTLFLIQSCGLSISKNQYY